MGGGGGTDSGVIRVAVGTHQRHSGPDQGTHAYIISESTISELTMSQSIHPRPYIRVKDICNVGLLLLLLGRPVGPGQAAAAKARLAGLSRPFFQSCRVHILSVGGGRCPGWAGPSGSWGTEAVALNAHARTQTNKQTHNQISARTHACTHACTLAHARTHTTHIHTHGRSSRASWS